MCPYTVIEAQCCALRRCMCRDFIYLATKQKGVQRASDNAANSVWQPKTPSVSLRHKRRCSAAKPEAIGFPGGDLLPPRCRRYELWFLAATSLPPGPTTTWELRPRTGAHPIEEILHAVRGKFQNEYLCVSADSAHWSLSMPPKRIRAPSQSACVNSPFDCTARCAPSRLNAPVARRLHRDCARSANYVKLHIIGGMLSTQKCGVGAVGADFIGCAIAATQHF